MRKSLLIWCFCFLIPVCTMAEGENLAHAKMKFAEGNELYKAGDYEKALNAYLEAAENARGFSINYNLGNTYFKRNQLPESILHYERALKFDPSNEDAAHNLKLVNAQIADRIETLPKSKLNIWWEEFRYGMGPEGWGKVSIVLALISAMLFFLFYILGSRSARRFAFFTALVFLGLTLTSVFLARSAQIFRDTHVSAIIFTDKVDVRSEPREGSTNVFVLHAGTKVHLISQEGDWYEVEIASGNQGWVKGEDLERV